MSIYVWESAVWGRVNNKPVIYIFSRDIETKQLKRFIIDGFKPYLYVECPKGTIDSVPNCFGNPVSKIVCNSPDEVYAIKRSAEAKGKDTFEADIAYDYRYLIDKKIQYGHNEKMQPVDVTEPFAPRVVFFDIEVNIPKGEPIDEGLNKYPIVSISVLDTYTKESKVFTVGDKKVHDKQVPCGSESQLLSSFVTYIQSVNPDIMTGWNVSFDMGYIFGRALVNKVDLTGLTRTGWKVKDPMKLSGRTVIDMMAMFKLWNKPNGQLPTYGLKYVAKHIAKFEYDAYGEHINELIEQDKWDTIVQYCLNDTLALQMIDDKCGLIIFYENLRRICGIKYEDTSKNTKVVETLLLRGGIKPIPSFRKHPSSKFEGALVIQPTFGIHNNVIFLDAKSLYPSIIIAFGLSPDVDKMIPKTITYILNEREKYRALKLAGKATTADETTEQSLKYIANSFYGVMGSPYFKLFDPDIAAFITKSGREINKFIQEIVRNEGHTIIYGDTDSVAISDIPSVEVGKALEAKVNDGLLAWARKHGIRDEFAPTVKFEKYFRKMFFKKKTGSEEAAKKKYVGHLIWKDGKEKDQIDYTGIEIKRSDTAPITKRLMEDFFERILRHEDIDGAIKEVKRVMKEVKEGKVSVHDVAIPKGLKMFVGENAWQRGIRHGVILLNIKFDSSKKPKLLYCRTPYNTLCIDDEVNDDEVRRVVTVDWSMMADKVIAQKMRSLIESLDYNWEQVVGGQNTLDGW